MSTEQGYIFIADITGYTQYLNESELDHAQKSLTALLNLLIRQTRPPLTISRLAGDAVISYGLQNQFFSGQTFLELIEDTYVAFRRAIDMMVMNTTCDCNACRNIGALDLKFFVHYGSFALQKLDAHDELVGSDVNMIHRLLKNTVSETTGFRAYALFTDAAIEQLNLRSICEVMQQHVEIYEHLGEVTIWVQDMHPVWTEKKETVEITVPPEQIIFEVETTIDLPIEVVWDHLVDVEYRSILMGSDHLVIDEREKGRVSEGSKYICYHGDQVTVQTVVHWKPFDHLITHDRVELPISEATVVIDYRLYESGSGTRFIHGFGKPIAGPLLGRLFANLMGPLLKGGAQEHVDAFGEAVEMHMQALGDEADAPTAVQAAKAAFESLSGDS